LSNGQFAHNVSQSPSQTLRVREGETCPTGLGRTTCMGWVRLAINADKANRDTRQTDIEGTTSVVRTIIR